MRPLLAVACAAKASRAHSISNAPIMSLTPTKNMPWQRNATPAASTAVSSTAAVTRVFDGLLLFNVPPLRADLALGPCGICYPVRLTVYFLTQIFPNIVRHFEKHSHHFRIKLPPGPLQDFGTRRLQRLLRTIGTIRGDCIESIGDRKDASYQG